MHHYIKVKWEYIVLNKYLFWRRSVQNRANHFDCFLFHNYQQIIQCTNSVRIWRHIPSLFLHLHDKSIEHLNSLCDPYLKSSKLSNALIMCITRICHQLANVKVNCAEVNEAKEIINWVSINILRNDILTNWLVWKFMWRRSSSHLLQICLDVGSEKTQWWRN